MGLSGFFVIFCQGLVKISPAGHHQLFLRKYPLEQKQISNYKDSNYIKTKLKQSNRRREETK